jgi:hypothetical protein
MLVEVLISEIFNCTYPPVIKDGNGKSPKNYAFKWTFECDNSLDGPVIAMAIIAAYGPPNLWSLDAMKFYQVFSISNVFF